MERKFSEFEKGDKIEVTYTIYETIGQDRDRKETTVSTVSNGMNEVGNLEWEAGSTGVGVIRTNGHVFDGNGTKIGIDATVSHLE